MDKIKLIISIVLGSALICSAWLLMKGGINFRNGSSKIKVTGMAEKQITSDLIVWYITLKGTGEKRSQAYHSFKETESKVYKFLTDNGIKKEWIERNSPDANEVTESVYNDQTHNWVTVNRGYAVSGQLTVRTKDMKKVEDVYQLLPELYNEGLDFSSTAPMYYYTKLNDLKMEMLNKASANAYERAKTIATGSNASVGNLLESSMGVFQILGVNSTEEYSWGGTFNTDSKDKKVSITVKATYEVN